MVIQVQTKESLSLYTYDNSVSPLNNHDVFTHPLWNLLSNKSFGMISVIDTDQSLVTQHVLSDTSDLGFVIIRINDTLIQKGDFVTITLLSGDMIQKTISFTTPLPVNTIVDLW